MSDIVADFPRRAATATGAPRQKVLAATGGAGVATAVAAIAIWLLNKAGLNLPSNIGDALTTVIVAVVTFAAGYACPPGSSEGVVQDDGGSFKAAIVPTR